MSALREVAGRVRAEGATLTTLVSDGELWVDERIGLDGPVANKVWEAERFAEPLAPWVDAVALRRLAPHPGDRTRYIHGIARRGKLLGVLELSRVRSSGRGPGAGLDALAVHLERMIASLPATPSGHLVLGPTGPELIGLGLDGLLEPGFIAALEDADRRGEERVVLGRMACALRPLRAPDGGSHRTLVAITPADRVALPPSIVLSTRRREVAELAAAGATIAQIAVALDASPETVKSHLKAIYQELGVSTRLELRVTLDAV